jgi:hypothetical protein
MSDYIDKLERWTLEVNNLLYELTRKDHASSSSRTDFPHGH